MWFITITHARRDGPQACRRPHGPTATAPWSATHHGGDKAGIARLAGAEIPIMSWSVVVKRCQQRRACGRAAGESSGDWPQGARVARRPAPPGAPDAWPGVSLRLGNAFASGVAPSVTSARIGTYRPLGLRRIRALPREPSPVLRRHTLHQTMADILDLTLWAVSHGGQVPSSTFCFAPRRGLSRVTGGVDAVARISALSAPAASPPLHGTAVRTRRRGRGEGNTLTHGGA